MIPEETQALIAQAAKGNEEAIRIIAEALRFQIAMRTLFDLCHARAALILVGRFYGGMTIRKLGWIFRMSHQHINNIERKSLYLLSKDRR